jgi:uncharacterized protein (UPF0333 family)
MFLHPNKKAQVAVECRADTASHSRGQVAVEFLLYSSLFIFIVISAFVSLSFIQNSELPARESSLVKEMGSSFASAINLAAEGGEGFSYNYTFPQTLLGRDYEIAFDDKEHRMAITWQNGVDSFTYRYPMAAYAYKFEGSAGCVSDKKLLSSECKNVLKFYNDGTTVTISQEGSP